MSVINISTQRYEILPKRKKMIKYQMPFKLSFCIRSTSAFDWTNKANDSTKLHAGDIVILY
jgi:hypothetical protein